MDVFWTAPRNFQPATRTALVQGWVHRISVNPPKTSRLMRGSGTCRSNAKFSKTRSWNSPTSPTRTSIGNKSRTSTLFPSLIGWPTCKMENADRCRAVTSLHSTTLRCGSGQQLDNLLLAWQQLELPVIASLLQHARHVAARRSRLLTPGRNCLPIRSDSTRQKPTRTETTGTPAMGLIC